MTTPEERAAVPLEHDKRCMCTDAAYHRLLWTNWKLVQAEQELATHAQRLEEARAELRQIVAECEVGWRTVLRINDALARLAPPA